MDPLLYECALNGDIALLNELISGGEHVLDGSEAATPKTNILHIAAMYGHVDFARKVMELKLELSRELNEAGFSPLHLAAAKGRLDLVKLLLALDPDLSCLKDKHGRLPAHTAAMKGRVDVLKEIISVNPSCLKKRTDEGETVLHLSVKQESKAEVVEFLLGEREVKNMVNEGDCGGNTPLHLAAARNRREIIGILLRSGTANVNALNSYNVTAYDLIRLREPNKDDEIVRLLNPNNGPAAAATKPAVDEERVRLVNPNNTAAASSSQPAAQGEIVTVDSPNNAPAASTEHAIQMASLSNSNDTPPSSRPHEPASTENKHVVKEQFKQSGSLMIVAILIATVTFQAAITPPGGFWQADSICSNNSTTVDQPSLISTPNSLTRCNYTAGTAVLFASSYDRFMKVDVFAFVGSLSMILLLLIMNQIGEQPFMYLCIFVNVCWETVFLGLAFYYAIDATEPAGSVASRYAGRILLTCIPFMVALLLLSASQFADSIRGMHRPDPRA